MTNLPSNIDPREWSKVRKIISEVLNVEKDRVKSGIDIIQDLGADSLDMIEIMSRIEDQFMIDDLGGDLDNNFQGIRTGLDLLCIAQEAV